MTVGEIKNEVMFQTNNDADDLGDFMPYLMDYINEGYDRLVYAWAGVHPSDVDETWALLHEDTDTPDTPEWTHRALVDYATWLIYRNGNSQKQNRGYAFRGAFDEMIAKITSQGGINGKVTHFKNIPW